MLRCALTVVSLTRCLSENETLIVLPTQEISQRHNRGIEFVQQGRVSNFVCESFSVS